ncbi:cupredoxin domain-containing protein [Flavicella marina]|uniref:cupredoxin domain-containing protein n=1 Tax=Flavicella marina TaxID=1475951 RepID=UPI00126582D9|nr:cupredoxin domain-containing protein [Flavicella marina]
MKKVIILSIITVIALFSVSTNAQSAKTIKLEQTTGDFSVHGLVLSEGDYVFEIANNGVDHEVGFVIAPKGHTDQAHHIKEGYVKEVVKDGKSSLTNVVKLKKGTYVYFCPLNPTPQYEIVVQ